MFERQFLSASWSVLRAGRAGPAARERLAALQSRRLSELVAFARAQSPFYRSLYAGLPERVDSVAQLPVTTKAELMSAFADGLTDRRVSREAVQAFMAGQDHVGRLYLGRYAVWTTSGSSGRPGIFLHDVSALGVYAALLVMRCWLRWLPWRGRLRLMRQGIRAAYVVATGGPFAAAEFQALAERRFGSRSASSRAFSVQQPLPDLVAALNAFKPTILAGYPTAIALLADEQRLARLRVRPELVATGGESLDPATRESLAAAFDCPVRDMYGATEFIALASDCGQGWLHLNADWAILEAVDAAYRPVPPGEPSHTVLLTNLANRVQPVLRYDLGDSVTLSGEACACGSPLPAMRVEGRCDEVLAITAADGSLLRLPPLALVAEAEAVPGVERFQIIQSAPATLRIRLAVEPGANPVSVWTALAARLGTFLAARGAPGTTVERDPEPPRRDPRTGKFRQVWSERRGGDPRAGW